MDDAAHEPISPELSDLGFIQAAVSSLLGRQARADELPYFHSVVAQGGRQSFVDTIICCEEFKDKFLQNAAIGRSLLKAAESRVAMVGGSPVPISAKLYPIPVVVYGKLYSIYDFPPFQALKWICEELNRDCYGLLEIDLPPGGTVVDIGAHIGLFSLAARSRWPGARIISFEPFPATYALLRENLNANRCADVESHNLGISVDGRDVALASQLDANSGATSSWSTPLEQMRVVAGKTMTFEEAGKFFDIGTIDLLKVDCEGFEHEIFGEEFPYDRVKNLSVEIHHSDRLADLGFSPERLIERLMGRFGPGRLRFNVVNI